MGIWGCPGEIQQERLCLGPTPSIKFWARARADPRPRLLPSHAGPRPLPDSPRSFPTPTPEGARQHPEVGYPHPPAPQLPAPPVACPGLGGRSGLPCAPGGWGSGPLPNGF